MNNPRNHVYSRIKRLRKESGLSQRQLADKLDITQQQYQIYESGKREMPLFLLIAIADYFQVSLDYLTERVSDRQELYINKVLVEEKAQLESRIAEIDTMVQMRLKGG